MPASPARRAPITKKLQKVDAEVGLRLDDPLIDRDAAILAKLRMTVIGKMARRGAQAPLQEKPTLYSWYRGTGFPLRQPNGKRLPAWRDLTSWTKAQVATLVLSEQGWMPFKIHVHDDLWAQWKSDNRAVKDELRNSIQRHLKLRFGANRPQFFFVIEDRTTAGYLTRPHVHGSIGVAQSPIPWSGKGSRKLHRVAEQDGAKVAELEAGREVMREALKAAAGMSRPRIAQTSGIDQARNVWLPAKPHHAIFNHPYVDYAFRNTKAVSPTLGDNRFAMVQPLRAEAERLWNLIKRGESSIDQWERAECRNLASKQLTEIGQGFG